MIRIQVIRFNEDVEIYNIGLDDEGDIIKRAVVGIAKKKPPVKKKNEQKARSVENNKFISIEYKGVEFSIDEFNSLLTIGRGKDNNMIIFLLFVSRNHASIKFQGGRIVLTNNSPNGTFIRYSDADEETKCITECNIVGSGEIGFGCPIENKESNIIRFSVNKTVNANDITKNLGRNHYNDEKTIARTKEIYSDVGKADSGEELIDRTTTETTRINNEAAGLLKAGKIEDAIEMFMKAASIMPSNVIVNMNTAYAILMQMKKTGNVKRKYSARVEYYLQRVHELDPANVKYYKLMDMLQRFIVNAKVEAA